MISCIIFFGISLIVLILNEKQLQEERELRNYLIEKMKEESD